MQMPKVANTLIGLKDFEK